MCLSSLSAPPLQSTQLLLREHTATAYARAFATNTHTRRLIFGNKTETEVPGIKDVLTDKRGYKHEPELHKTADTKRQAESKKYAQEGLERFEKHNLTKGCTITDLFFCDVHRDLQWKATV